MSFGPNDDLFAGEKARWYMPDGTPCGKVLKRKKRKADPDEYRDYNLTDARKDGAYPSVTTITGQAPRPGLDKWKERQLLLACLTSPVLSRQGELDDKQLVRLLLEDRDAQAAEAREVGSQVHGAICKSLLEGQPIEPDLIETVIACRNVLKRYAPLSEWKTEQPLVHAYYGYAGTIDAYCDKAIVDFKGREFTGEIDPKKYLYDSEAMQLAAYMMLVYDPEAPPPALVNVLFSRNEPGNVVVYEWSPREFMRASAMFMTLLSYFKHERGYFPNAKEVEARWTH